MLRSCFKLLPCSSLPQTIRRVPPSPPMASENVRSIFLAGLLFVCLGTVCLAEAQVQSLEMASQQPGVTAGETLEAQVARLAKIGHCISPSFSPDGQRLAFVSDLNGIPQVWTIPIRGGFPSLVTTLDDQVGAVQWSPQGETLVFNLAPGGGMNQQVYRVETDGSDLRRLTAGGRDNNWMGMFDGSGKWLSWSSNVSDAGSMDVWLHDMTTGEERLAVDNEGIGRLADLDAAGRRGVVYRMVSRGDDNLYLVDLETGAEALLTPHEGPGSFAGGTFSADGRSVYMASNAGRDLSALARVSLDEMGRPGPIEVLVARDDAELESFEISHGGSVAALVWNHAGKNAFQLLDLATLETLASPELPAEIISDLTFSPDDRHLAMVLSGAAMPLDIWVLELASMDLWRVTRSPHAGIDLAQLVRPELVRYSAHDGLELSAWLYRPPGAQGGAPFVLSFHGGPEGQERPRFNSTYQALVQRGIGVLAPNVRGSAGFGKRFVNLDNGALRFDGIKDIEASAQFLLDNHYSAKGQLGIMGGSYGGYMTMAGLAWYPDLFAAGANLFGVVNFETFFAQTEPWMAAVSKIEYGDPATQGDLLRELSPIHRLDAVKAPTLVLHGANDTNVPVVEAEQVVDHLKARGVPVSYVLFPDEGHGFRKTPNRLRMVVEIVRWFETYLGQS